MPDRPTAGTGELEQRTAPEAPAPTVDGERRLHGVIPYETRSRDLGQWTEVIDRGALEGADLGDLIATRDHNPSALLGRFPGTVEVEDRADGFHWSVELPDSPTGNDVRVAVERGDLKATSWRMTVAEDRWDGDTRHVCRIGSLKDVAVVHTAAYDSAVAEYRSAPEPSPAPAPPAVEPAPDPDPEPEEATVPEVIPGGVVVEDRAADDQNVETRVLEALRGVRKGESRALTTAVSVAPAEVGTYLFDRMRASSVGLSSGLTVLSTERDSVVYPALTADVAPAWYAEASPITPGDPTFASITATPRKLAHLVQCSNEVLDDSDPSILDILNGHLLRVLALKLDIGLFEGSGTAPEIRGLANVPGIQTVDAGTNGAQPSLDQIADAVALLEAANTTATAIVMSPRTFGKLRKAKDVDGNYLLGPAVAGQTPRSLFGVPVYVSGQLSTTEAAGTAGNVGSSIYVYNAAEVVYVRRQEIELELDRSRLYNSDQSELRAKLRGDLLVPNPSAVVRILRVL